MAAYLQDEEGLGSSVGAAFFGLVCLLFSPASERRGLGSVFFLQRLRFSWLSRRG